MNGSSLKLDELWPAGIDVRCGRGGWTVSVGSPTTFDSSCWRQLERQDSCICRPISIRSPATAQRLETTSSNGKTHVSMHVTIRTHQYIDLRTPHMPKYRITGARNDHDDDSDNVEVRNNNNPNRSSAHVSASSSQALRRGHP